MERSSVGWAPGSRSGYEDGPATCCIWPDLRKLLVWLAVGVLVALRTFRWERAA
jgi:hypothetical protein